MKILWYLIAWFLFLNAPARASEPPTIAQGERIELPELGFSIVPPTGWKVERNSHGATLLFEAPKQSDQVYQPTIQVLSFSKPRFIDSVTQKEFGDLILKQFSNMSNRITAYHLRSSEIIATETGDPSILFYTEFQYDDVSIMQMHILISSSSNHFLMSYTDLSKVIEDENSPSLAIAYTTMHSAQLSSKAPARFATLTLIGLGIGALLVLWFVFHRVRSHRITQLGQSIEDEDGKDYSGHEESQHYSSNTQTTGIEQSIVRGSTSDAWASLKTKSRTPAPKNSQRRDLTDIDDDDDYEVSEAIPLSELTKGRPGRPLRQEPAPLVPKTELPRSSPSAQAPVSKPPANAEKLASQPPRQMAPTPLAAPIAVPPATVVTTTPPPAQWKTQFNPTLLTEDEGRPDGYDPITEPESAPMQASRPKPNPPLNSGKGPRIPNRSKGLLERAPPEMTEEARLSEILPRAGTIDGKPKRRRFFWNRKSDDLDIEKETKSKWSIGDSKKSRPPAKKNDDEDSEDKNQWNLEGSKKTGSIANAGDAEDDSTAKQKKDQWADEPTKKSGSKSKPLPPADPATEDGGPWAPESTRSSAPSNSLLHETQQSQQLPNTGKPGVASAAAKTSATPTNVTENDWNLQENHRIDGEEGEDSG